MVEDLRLFHVNIIFRSSLIHHLHFCLAKVIVVSSRLRYSAIAVPIISCLQAHGPLSAYKLKDLISWKGRKSQHYSTVRKALQSMERHHIVKRTPSHGQGVLYTLNPLTVFLIVRFADEPWRLEKLIENYPQTFGVTLPDYNRFAKCIGEEAAFRITKGLAEFLSKTIQTEADLAAVMKFWKLNKDSMKGMLSLFEDVGQDPDS